MSEACRSCGARGLVAVFSADAVPVENSLLYPDAATARAAPRGDLRIAQCPVCGFVTNTAFDPALVRYDGDYESSQGFSGTFMTHANGLVDEMITRFGLAGGRALEIGCGGGDFLRLFVERAGGTGVGLDPVLATTSTDGPVELRPELFGPGSGHHDADVVLIRHTLEHIVDVAGFLTTLRTELGTHECVVHIEVPDLTRIAEDGAFWDLYYEHCSYFTAATLRDLLARCGFDPIEVRRDYHDQYLVAYARPAARPATAIAADAEPVDLSSVGTNIAAWQAWVDARVGAGARIAFWAASSKAVAVLSNLVGLEPVVAVDINPAKSGRFLPVSATPVCRPDELAPYAPDVVVVMNPIYAEEIRADLAAAGVRVDLWGMASRPLDLSVPTGGAPS